MLVCTRRMTRYCKALVSHVDFILQVASDVSTRLGTGDTTTYQQTYPQPGTLAQIQAKEADIQALAQLTRALDKKVMLPWII